MVFFIFLVSNIGGALTPIGDPPLFLGYLRGIDFSKDVKTVKLGFIGPIPTFGTFSPLSAPATYGVEVNYNY